MASTFRQAYKREKERWISNVDPRWARESPIGPIRGILQAAQHYSSLSTFSFLSSHSAVGCWAVQLVETGIRSRNIDVHPGAHYTHHQGRILSRLPRRLQSLFQQRKYGRRFSRCWTYPIQPGSCDFQTGFQVADTDAS